MQENLKWNQHVEYIRTKVSRSCYILSKVRHFVDKDTSRMLYYSLIHNYLNYCISSWGGSSKSVLDPLIKLQKKAIRFISHSAYDSHTKPLFNNLRIMNLHNIYNFNVVIALYKIINNNKTKNSNSLLNLTNLHSHNTRLSSGQNFYQNFNRTNFGKTTYTTQGIRFWRQLPTEFKSMPFQVFKFKTKKYILDNQ